MNTEQIEAIRRSIRRSALNEAAERYAQHYAPPPEVEKVEPDATWLDIFWVAVKFFLAVWVIVWALDLLLGGVLGLITGILPDTTRGDAFADLLRLWM